MMEVGKTIARLFWKRNTVRGFVDGINFDLMSGWAFDERDPGRHCLVEIRLGKELITTAHTTVLREDVNAAFSIVGEHGFVAQIPGEYCTGEPLTLRVLCRGALLEWHATATYPPTFRPRPEHQQIIVPPTRIALKKPPPPGNIRGGVEGIEGPFIKGWIEDLSHPETILTVEIHDGEDRIARVPANLASSSSNQQGASHGRGGFACVLPAALFDDRFHPLRVSYQGWLMPWSERQGYPPYLTRVNLKRIPNENRYQGKIEGITTESVWGWAWDRMNSRVPVHIAIYVDDVLQGITRANRYAARLKNLERDGCQFFEFRFRRSLMQGHSRKVKAVIVEGGFVLPDQGLSPVLFPLVDIFARQLEYEAPAVYSFFNDCMDSCSGTSPANPGSGNRIPDAPVVSIIVLNWNGADLLDDFLRSVTAAPPGIPYEILVVDHGSTDASLAILADHQTRLPLTVLPRGSNYSFSSSNNVAARQAKGKYLLFANNDIVLLDGCVGNMLQHFGTEGIGVVGARLLEPLRSGRNEWKHVCHHQGVRFRVELFPESGVPYYKPVEIGETGSPGLTTQIPSPAVTFALAMCRKADFLAVGGFHEDYFYGLEDVDLCLRMTLNSGKGIITETSAVAIHNRSATRDQKIEVSVKDAAYGTRPHVSNHAVFVRRFGRLLPRKILEGLMVGSGYWREQPLCVTFAVTKADPNTAAGDFFTALELADALRRLFGWDVQFTNQTNQVLPGTDVLVVMRHDYKIRNISAANPGLLTIAWLRNRVDQWLEDDGLQPYQLILCSSKKIIEAVKAESGRVGVLFPIATNPHRFNQKPVAPDYAADLCFTGSYWGDDREALNLRNGRDQQNFLAIYGHGWDKYPDWGPCWRGAAAYTDLPEIYSSAKMVLDDSHPVTREWNSLNSRVFDALGCGTLVLTNCTGGAKEVFGDTLPTFEDAGELDSLMEHYLGHPESREALAETLHKEVIGNHTYDIRAVTFKETVAAHLRGGSYKFSIKIGIPRVEEQERWGDFHFAIALRRALEKAGHFARVDILPHWYGGLSAGDEIVIVLRGLSEYKPNPTTLNLLWLISHPEAVTVAELRQYDHVFVASEGYTEILQRDLGEQVSTLLQCTDPDRFFPEAAGAESLRDAIVFIGNSRNQRREVVDYALQAGLDLSVYGSNWEQLLPAERLKGEYIPNEQLRHYYTAAGIVLNDHWQTMRDAGFISNRIFDAGACGATIVTDEMAACRNLFGDSLAYYHSPESLAELIHRLRSENGSSRTAKDRLRSIILDHHTFKHRAEAIMEVVRAAYRFPGD